MKKLLLGLVLIFSGCLPYVPQPIAESTATLAAPAKTFTPSAVIEGAIFTPAPTATPIPNPMTIAAMRAGSYPGSDISIVKELDRGLNYHRYYAYYLSEGLRI